MANKVSVDSIMDSVGQNEATVHVTRSKSTANSGFEYVFILILKFNYNELEGWCPLLPLLLNRKLQETWRKTHKVS